MKPMRLSRAWPFTSASGRVGHTMEPFAAKAGNMCADALAFICSSNKRRGMVLAVWV